MIVKILFVLVALSHVNCDEYDDNVVFTVSLNSQRFIWNHMNTTLTSLGCDTNGKFAFVVHGFFGSTSPWIQVLVKNLLKYRGGCVISVNWGYFSNNYNYDTVISDYWPGVSALLTRKLVGMESEGINPAKIFMYGHSLGARLVVDAAINFGPKKIGMIDTCDPAGPGFYFYDFKTNPKKAAKNVQSIHTSILLGTATRNSHQDFIMGQCGITQPASSVLLLGCQGLSFCKYTNETEASISHSLCNDFYNSAFTHKFVVKNKYNCPFAVNIKKLPARYKMGYDESRTPVIRGIISVPTTEKYPYNV